MSLSIHPIHELSAFYHRNARILAAILIVLAALIACFAVLRAPKGDPFGYGSYTAHLVTEWFLQAPPALALFSVAASGMAIGLAVHATFIRLTKFEWVQGITGEHNEIVGHFLGLVGVIYAVVLAFTVATAWQSYDNARTVAEQEQHDAVLLFQIMDGYSDVKNRIAIKNSLFQYAKDLDGEWTVMDHDERFCYFLDRDCPPQSLKTGSDVRNLGKSIVSLSLHSSQSMHDAIVYQKSLDLWGAFTEARNERRHHYSDRLLQSLWWAFAFGAVIVVVVSYLLAGQDPRSQRVRTMALGAMVGIMIGLVVIFDHPYTGQEAATFKGENWCRAVRYFGNGSHHTQEWLSRTNDCAVTARR